MINALKHAFPNQGNGQIQVAYCANANGWKRTLGDNGVGMPAIIGRQARLGTTIVRALTKQLHATGQVEPGHLGILVTVKEVRLRLVDGAAAKQKVQAA